MPELSPISITKNSNVLVDISSEIKSQGCKIGELEKQLQNVTTELNLHRKYVNGWINQCKDFIK